MNTATKLAVFLFLWCFLCLQSVFFPKSARADVYINEFSSYETSDDWIEFYSTEDIDISGWVLRDSATTSKMATIPDGVQIGPSKSSKFYVIYVGSRLNRDGDLIKLLKPDDTTLVNETSYGDSGGICAPSSGGSAGRYPDGSGTFKRFRVPTILASNNDSSEDPCPTPVNSMTPTPTQIPESLKTIYKINNAKDGDGNVLGQVKIYVDSQYTGNYTEETYTFCDDCKCGSNNIPCGFGSHTFKTEKDGYSDWSETKNIIAGETYEVSPVMNKESSSTATPTSTPTKTPTPSPTKTPAPKPTATSTPTPSSSPETSPSEVQVLGAEIVLSPTPKVGASDSKKIPAFAYVFVIVGVLVLGAGGYLLFVSSKKEYNGKTDEGKIES